MNPPIVPDSRSATVELAPMRRGPLRAHRGTRGGLAAAPLSYLGLTMLLMSRFLERIAAGMPLVADGGMGALLASAVPGLRRPEEANLRAAETVVDVHVGYIRAGADIIETNTFGASRPKLAQHFIED